MSFPCPGSDDRDDPRGPAEPHQHHGPHQHHEPHQPGKRHQRDETLRQPGRAIARLEARRPRREQLACGDVVEVLRAKAASLDGLARAVQRLREEGWRTEGEVGLAFSLGVDGVSLVRDLAAFSELEQAADSLPHGTVIHWHRHDRTWRSGGWIVGLPADHQLGELDDLPVIVQSTRSGRQTRCADQRDLVAAVRLHLQEVVAALEADPLREDGALREQLREARAQIAALEAGEAPQVLYRFEGSPEAEDALTSAHMIHVHPEALSLWEGFQDGIAREPLYEGDQRLEGLTGLAFREGFGRGSERGDLLTEGR